MPLSRMTPPALLALALLALAGPAQAGPPHRTAPLVPPATPPAAPLAECAPCTQTICVRELEKKPHTKTVYRCKTKTICLPYCGGKLCGRCDTGCGECGKPRQVRTLIKRFVKEEHCETPCKPKEVPAAPACAAPAPCALPALTGAPAHGTVIYGVTQPRGK